MKMNYISDENGIFLGKKILKKFYLNGLNFPKVKNCENIQIFFREFFGKNI